MAQPFPTMSPIHNTDRAKSPFTPTQRIHTVSASRHDHPYLIRTTSSSLLTRSNSIGSVHKPQIHAAVSPASPALGRSQGRGHRRNKSSTVVPPPSLPPPPMSPERESSAGATAPLTSHPDIAQLLSDDEMRGRLRRSGTTPSVSSKITQEHLSKIEDLPSNPKAWTSTHLASYLSSALRVKGGGSLPVPVVRDVASFVVDQKLGGRAFLRLTAKDLEEMGMNQLWRPALLNAARILRQNVVQGRIWGFGSDDITTPSSPSSTSVASSSTNRTSLPSVPSTVFEDKLQTDAFSDRSAHSGPEEQCEGEGWIARGMLTRPRSDSGKVKSLVATFERSASGSSADEFSGEDRLEFSPEPFDYSSPLSANQELAAVVEEDHPTHGEEARVDFRSPVGEGDDGFASGELTSESEGESEAEGTRAGDITTFTENADLPEGVVPRSEASAVSEDDDTAEKSTDSDVSPTSSVLPQTPPPIYATDPVSTEAALDVSLPSPNDTTLHGVNLDSPTKPSRSQPGSTSSSLVLTTSVRNPSYMAHITKDSGSDETIENLISSFNSVDNPLAASWGANAWLDENPLGSTARKIHSGESNHKVVSISRRGNRPLTFGKPGHGSRPELTELFEPAPKPKKKDISVDATMPEAAYVAVQAPNDEPTMDELLAKQARQEEILEQFRVRLEAVEMQLEELEKKELAKAATANAEVPAAENSSVGVQQPKAVAEEEDGWEDPTPSGIPSYVFLVGIGVAAVVMRVMIRKVVGRKANMLGFA